LLKLGGGIVEDGVQNKYAKKAMVAIANTVIGLWMVSGIGALLTPGPHFC
jgi:hypothetical protein